MILSETYFGWSSLPHFPTCAKPTIDFGYKLDRNQYATNDKLLVRVVCLSCSAALTIGATTPRDQDDETHVIVERHESTDMIGYGAPPVKGAGLYAHPDRKMWDHDDMPIRYYVTETAAVPRQPSDVVAIISARVAKRGKAVRWSAYTCAPGRPEAEQVAFEDLRTVAAALKAVSATLATVATS